MPGIESATVMYDMLKATFNISILFNFSAEYKFLASFDKAVKKYGKLITKKDLGLSKKKKNGQSNYKGVL